ncbi:protoporphyrinogen oxidase [Granulicella sibirica]|uniref:Coproporphyrinogen III oxidase n=1 Tax=Granulicella sibirica TaxID=2479048 RepID=A0A4Q0STR0_9BACT|nr:protoporphyrinogen oxidase [Granulicella sibirica]RXH54385.1 Protoporphyrinogen IX oxidase, aerobic, HemY [Granulicella sibirica]
MKRIAIVGGGLAGVAAAYFLARAKAEVEVVLYEASGRLGGIVETVREGGFVVECGPDGWVTEKPWALELARELGLGEDVIWSLDEGRKTYVRLDGRLEAMPDGMRMMVPGDMEAVERSELFSEGAKQAFREEIGRAEELKAMAPEGDESVGAFVERHFGREVLEKVAGPLLSGVFGGDVGKLSVRAVMPAFVAMEREFGSLILALKAKTRGEKRPIFTSLKGGVGMLVERMVAEIPAGWVRLGEEVKQVEKVPCGWVLGSSSGTEHFDAVLMAAPVDVARRLLEPVDRRAAQLMEMEASSAVVVGFCFADGFDLPPGFGFLVPQGQGSLLLACTFTDQKFAGRVPAGARQVRAFFGAKAGERLLACGNDEIASVARLELGRMLGRLPEPVLTVVRRWPRSLPQYAVGHLERMAELNGRVKALEGIWLLGNGYRGVGLPDLIRDAQAAVGEIVR